MTSGEVRRALGLKPWHEHAHEVQQLRMANLTGVMDADDLIKDRMRQTGRTTRMICSALAAMSRGVSVVFRSGSGHSEALITEQARLYAKKLGLDASLLSQVAAEVEFFDHLFYEMNGLELG